MRIKKGDTVKILTGKDRNKIGKITKVIDGKKVIIEGLNLYKKHIRPKKEGEKGEIVQLAKPITVSNVGFFCANCKKAVRLGARLTNDKKIRFCKICKSNV